MIQSTHKSTKLQNGVQHLIICNGYLYIFGGCLLIGIRQIKEIKSKEVSKMSVRVKYEQFINNAVMHDTDYLFMNRR